MKALFYFKLRVGGLAWSGILKQEISHLSLQPLEALADDDIWNMSRKHVPKTEKPCRCVFKDNCFICANKIVWKKNNNTKSNKNKFQEGTVILCLFDQFNCTFTVFFYENIKLELCKFWRVSSITSADPSADRLQSIASVALVLTFPQHNTHFRCPECMEKKSNICQLLIYFNIFLFLVANCAVKSTTVWLHHF